MKRLEGKVAIITGASGGIGAATAAKFLSEGAKVMLAGRDKARLDVVLSVLNAGDAAAICVGDPAEEADVVALVAAAKTRFGGIDILFANAGAEGPIAPLTSISVEEFDRVQHVNVRGTWLAIKHAGPAMVEVAGAQLSAHHLLRAKWAWLGLPLMLQANTPSMALSVLPRSNLRNWVSGLIQLRPPRLIMQ